VHLTWNWATEAGKRSAGAQRFAVKDLAGVDWTPSAGLENGHVRFRLKGVMNGPPPKHDPSCLLLWGTEKETRTVAMLLAAVVARLPHPSGVPELEVADAVPSDEGVPGLGGDDTDGLLRRLRELGELHRDGVLTDEEFTTAKQSLLRRL
jgi:hypothetical protein